MKAKFKVTLLVDANYMSDVMCFLSDLGEDRYCIEKIESLEVKNE